MTSIITNVVCSNDSKEELIAFFIQQIGFAKTQFQKEKHVRLVMNCKKKNIAGILI